MTKLATMGTSSCATIAISGFGDKDLEAEEVYRKEYRDIFESESGMTVEGFYKAILYPTEQELGETKNYPLSRLMKELDHHKMGGKFTILTLNLYQKSKNNGVWVKYLTEFGFEEIDSTNNDIGGMCYIFVRNKNRPEDSSVMKRV